MGVITTVGTGITVGSTVTAFSSGEAGSVNIGAAWMGTAADGRLFKPIPVGCNPSTTEMSIRYVITAVSTGPNTWFSLFIVILLSGLDILIIRLIPPNVCDIGNIP